MRNTDGSFETFDAPGAGTVFGDGTFPVSMNLSNTIAGVSYPNDDFTETGWLRNPDGSIVELSVPGSAVTLPGSINDACTVTGYYSTTAAGPAHGFVMSADGSFTLFGVPGASETLADVSGLFITFGVPGADFSDVADLNEGSEIIGDAIIPGAHGFTKVGGIS